MPAAFLNPLVLAALLPLRSLQPALHRVASQRDKVLAAAPGLRTAGTTLAAALAISAVPRGAARAAIAPRPR